MTFRAEWDGDRVLGALRLGMSITQAPLMLGVDDLVSDPPDPYDDEGDASYYSETAGLRLDCYQGVIWAINSFNEFWVQDSNLIGLTLEQLRERIGRVERDPKEPTALDDTTDYVVYLGKPPLEFLLFEGNVTCVVLADQELLPDD